MKILDRKYYIAIVTKVLMILTSFGITVFLNRGLGTNGKGVYAYYINLVELIYIIGTIGLGQAYATVKRSQKDINESNFLALSLIQSTISIIIGVMILLITSDYYLFLVSIMIGLSISKFIVSMIALVENSIKRNIVITIINVGYMLVMLVFFALKIMDVLKALLIYSLVEIITILALIISYKIKPSLKGLNKDKLLRIYIIGLISMVVTVLIEVNYKIDVLMIKVFSTDYSVGIYSVAVNLTTLFLLLPDAFKEVLFGDSTKKDFNKKIAYNSINSILCVRAIDIFRFSYFW